MSILDTIVSALRSLTGGGAEESTTASGSTEPAEGQVSVEHDPDAAQPTPDASTEAAIKGGDAPTETTSGDTAAGESEDDAPTESTDDAAVGEESEDAAVAAETDATASTGSLVDEETGREPAETVGEAGGVDVDKTTAESDVGDGSAAESDDTGDDDSTDGAESDDPDGTQAGSSDEVDDESEAVDESTEAVDESTEDDAEPTADGSTESVETIKGIGPAYAGRLEGIGIETVGELAAADAAEVADGIDVSESRVSDWIGRAGDGS